MAKRTIYTKITPLPKQLNRALVVEALHDHKFVISLNANISKIESCGPPANATPQEFHCVWYEMTEKIKYGLGISGNVKYKGCFYDLPKGMQAHVYAPMGLDIKNKWHVGGNEPGEPREYRELGVETPAEGLYLREDVDMRCNTLFSSFVVSQLKKAHVYLVERLVVKAEMIEAQRAHIAQQEMQQRASYMSNPQSTYTFDPHTSYTLNANDAYRFSPAFTSPTASSFSATGTHQDPGDSPTQPASPPPYLHHGHQSHIGPMPSPKIMPPGSPTPSQTHHVSIGAAPVAAAAAAVPAPPTGVVEMPSHPTGNIPVELPAIELPTSNDSPHSPPGSPPPAPRSPPAEMLAHEAKRSDLH